MREEIGIVLVDHGDVPRDFLWKEKKFWMAVERALEKMGDLNKKRKFTPTRENDPHWFDAFEFSKVLKKKGKYDIVEVGFMEFQTPTVSDAIEKAVKAGAEKIIAILEVALMHRSSHSLIEVVEQLEEAKEKHPDLEIEYIEPGYEPEDEETLAEIIIGKIEEPTK